MIGRLRRADREQRKLLFSLGTNFLTRVPGIIGVLWFLPLLRFGLGTDDYANLLASLALGTASAFLCGGFNTVGRRLIGEAYANRDRENEANAFASLLVANAGALSFAFGIIVSYSWMRGDGTNILVVAMLPAVVTFLTTFDAARSAYNEHYVTATLLFVLQVAAYAVGFLVPATRHSLVLGALVLYGAYLLTSLVTFALLVRNKPYLIHGRPVGAWRTAREGTMLAIADGLLMATLSLSVVWLQTSASAAISAWFATVVRLFQTFLVPVVLLVMPLSSYIRIFWNAKSLAQQQAFAKATLWMALGYGAIVAVALFAASRLYVSGLLRLPAPGGFLQILPSFLLFGAIVAYKGYSSVAYLVLNESAHLSSWTTAAIGVSVTLGAAASFTVGPLSVINVYALAAGLSMIVVLFWNAARFIRLPSTLPAE